MVEVRHESWNNPETISYFTERNVAFCNIDQPLIGRSLEATEHVTSPVGYVRLHGRNYDQWFEAEKGADRYNYLYSEAELAGWKEKIERIAQKAEVTYVVANNHFEAKAGVNALQLKHMLSGEASEGDGDAVEAISRAEEPLLIHCREMTTRCLCYRCHLEGLRPLRRRTPSSTTSLIWIFPALPISGQKSCQGVQTTYFSPNRSFGRQNKFYFLAGLPMSNLLCLKYRQLKGRGV